MILTRAIIIQGELELVTSRQREPEDYESAIAASLDAIDGGGTLVSLTFAPDRG